MQGAVRVVGRKASRPIHLRAQLLEKLSAWPGRKPQAREELKGVGADVWPAWLKAQLPDLCAGGASIILLRTEWEKPTVQQALVLNLSNTFPIVF